MEEKVKKKKEETGPIEEADRAGPECPNHIFPRAICQHRNILNDTEKYSQHNTRIFPYIQRNILNTRKYSFNEDLVVIERKNDATMQMLHWFDRSRCAYGRHLPLGRGSTKNLGCAVQQIQIQHSTNTNKTKHITMHLVDIFLYAEAPVKFLVVLYNKYKYKYNKIHYKYKYNYKYKYWFDCSCISNAV